MPRYEIIVKNDTMQQMFLDAKNVQELFDKAKLAFRESMVTALDSQGLPKKRLLQDAPQTIRRIVPIAPTAHLEPTKKELREKEERDWLNSMPD